MCGIIAYIGEREVYPILINGLKRLEYRGYDSAGVAVVTEEKEIKTYKKQGKVSALEAFVGDAPKAKIGMGHTRWATHGEPNDINAHPHMSQSGNFVIIHNGIIENYAILKQRLIARGYTFESETDTEVLVNLIEEVYRVGGENIPAEVAVRLALSKVEGAYGIVVLCKNEPDTIVAARKGSPLVIGVGSGEYFLASDATPLIEYTKNVIYLQDEDLVVVKKDQLILKTLKNNVKTPEVHKVDFNLQSIEKSGFEHFMLKEIFEQPKSVRDSYRGRINTKTGETHLGGLQDYLDQILSANKMVIIGCGTSWHAGLVGEYLIESLARISVEVEYGSEFRYRNPILGSDDAVIAISQSGETADTLAAIKMAKEREALVLGVCNVVGSSIPRETNAGIYTHAGPEIGVASTKAFTAQVIALTIMALHLGHENGTLSDAQVMSYVNEIDRIPQKIEKILKLNDQVIEIAEKFKNASNFLYLGRGYNFPVALEGALKLKEISYIHAEGYPAAEMKHGPIALIDENMPVVVIAPKDSTYEKIFSNIQEIKARKGVVIAIVTEGDKEIKKIADYVLEIPETEEFLTPLLTVVPLQLLSYHIAVMRDCNVDQPRNLAKSVTVE